MELSSSINFHRDFHPAFNFYTDFTFVYCFYIISLASDLSPPPEDFNGEVDMEIVLEALSVERIGRGFVTSNSSQANNL